jgi:hypothetical protein
LIKENELIQQEKISIGTAVDPKLFNAARNLLETNQEVLYLAAWHVKWPLTLGTSFMAITEDSLLSIACKANQFSFKNGFKPEVHNYVELKFSKFEFWEFKKIKDSKGRTWGMEFSFHCKFPPTRDVYYKSDLASAEKFQEIFDVNARRFSAVSATADVAQQLSAMNLLYQEGVLSESEFKRSKEIFLGKSADEEQRAERTLRSLKQLRDAGVLSEAEFATKKWDVLSGN